MITAYLMSSYTVEDYTAVHYDCKTEKVGNYFLSEIWE